MLKWFTRWNAENPIDVIRPAIVFGTIGAAVVAVVAVVAIGQPWPVETLQTGPRGTGMGIVKFRDSVEVPETTIAAFLQTTTAPVKPTGGEQTASAGRQNVPPGLEDLTVENYDRLLTSMRAWTGIPDLFEDPDNYQSIVGYTMIGMVRDINENWDGHVNANGQVGVTCYTCHRGQPVPSDVWFLSTPTVKAAQGWSANQNFVTPLSSYTSLPSDALEKYILDRDIIAVHDLESRVAGVPGQDGYPGIQNAERTYAFMNYIANSLGVNCTLCHNTRAPYDGAQVTPQWAIASLGIQLIQELNEVYLLPLEGTLPENRLGPLHGDVPKVGCSTCHKGQQRPLQGTDVIGNWPELATSEAPVYE